MSFYPLQSLSSSLHLLTFFFITTNIYKLYVFTFFISFSSLLLKKCRMYFFLKRTLLTPYFLLSYQWEPCFLTSPLPLLTILSLTATFHFSYKLVFIFSFFSSLFSFWGRAGDWRLFVLRVSLPSRKSSCLLSVLPGIIPFTACLGLVIPPGFAIFGILARAWRRRLLEACGRLISCCSFGGYC